MHSMEKKDERPSYGENTYGMQCDLVEINKVSVYLTNKAVFSFLNL